ncbi:unnamed protein product, partial [Allacma fusca]
MDVKPKVPVARKRMAKKFPIAAKGSVKCEGLGSESGGALKRPQGRRRGPSRGNKGLSEAEFIALKREKNRACAKQCRARKKVRYIYLEDVIDETEEKVKSLRKEMKYLKAWAKEFDNGVIPAALVKYRRDCGGSRASEDTVRTISSVAVAETNPVTDSTFVAEENMNEIDFNQVLRDSIVGCPQDVKPADVVEVETCPSVNLFGPIPQCVGMNLAFQDQQTRNSCNSGTIFIKTEDPPAFKTVWQLIYNTGISTRSKLASKTFIQFYLAKEPGMPGMSEEGADDEAYMSTSSNQPNGPNKELSESHLTSEVDMLASTQKKLNYAPFRHASRVNDLIEVEHVHYKPGVFGCMKRKWDTIGDVSADDQSDIEEGRWDFWKAYYCSNSDTANSTTLNEIFLAWSILYTTGQNSHQDLISLMLKHGGIAFLVVCLTVYIGVGYPMYVLETMMGQYGCRKPFTMIRLMAPYMQGIGPALWLRTLLSGVESLVTAIYGCIYFLDLYICHINHNQILSKFWLRQNSTLFDGRSLQFGFTDEPNGYVSDYGTREWIIFLLILTTVFALTGLRSFGKLYSLGVKGMFLIWLGYLVIVVLRTFGGKWDSLMYFPLRKALEANWSMILKGKVWMDAVFFVINTLGLVTLVHPYFASRCFFHYRTARDGILIIFLTIVWNLIGASAVLLFIGYITVNKKEMLNTLEQIGGYQGIFISYVMKVNQANLVGNLEYDIEFYFGMYYGMIAVSGLFAFHSCLRALIQCSYQEYTSIVLAMSVIIILMVIYCVGVPFVFISPDGLRILIFLEHVLHQTGNVIFLGGCFFWSVAYSHNFAKVVYDIRNMVHLTIFQPLGENYRVCAYYPKFYRNVIVILIVMLLIHSLARLPYPVRAGTDYSGNTMYVGIAVAVLPLLFVLIVWVLTCAKAEARKQNIYRPHRDWYKNWYHTLVCFAYEKLLKK